MDNSRELSEIQKFYKNGTVFLSGATGFIGKLVLEKLLRAVPVKKIILLVRKKNKLTANERLSNIFKSPAFDVIKKTKPDVLKLVSLMEGDCSLPMLGLGDEDQKTFLEEVNFVFHNAASIKFDESIRKTTEINVRASRDLIILAQQAKNMKAFVYVGTAYSNSSLIEIEEKIYQSKITAENLITACEVLDDKCLDTMTKTLIGELPNTYAFGKQVTEDFINRKARNIPICIVRPPVVVSTMFEPLVGFIDSSITVAGFVLANQSGLNRISYYKNIYLDIVPADIVVNTCIAAAWQTGISFMAYETNVPVYNVSSVADNPIKLDQIIDATNHYMKQVPSKKLLIMYPFQFKTTNRYIYFFWRMILHNWAAHIFDLILRLQGKEPMFVKAIAKRNKFYDLYEHFLTYTFFLHVDNIHKMLTKMSSEDKEIFNCDITTVNWDTYFTQYAKGLRVYLLKDPLDTVPDGQKHYRKLRCRFIGSIITIPLLLFWIGWFLWFRNIVT